jgi:hypothetical protein
MKTSIFALIFTFGVLYSAKISAQDCQSYYPVKQGTVTETTSYDAKNASTGMTRTTVTSNEATASGGYVVNVKSEAFDTKNVSTGTSEFSYSCKGGTFNVDMKSFFDPKSMSAYQNMDVSIDATEMDMPNNPTVGQTLKEGNLKIKISSGGFPVMNLEIRVFNRKVAALESVTTTAGTFDCIKITYDVETKSIMNITSKGADWFAKETGSIKSETYDQNGKLMTYSLLTKITH